MAEPVLKISNLSVEFSQGAKRFKAVNAVSSELAKSGVVGLVGESGCGKSVTARSIMRILPRTARVSDGSILLKTKSGEQVDILRQAPFGRKMREIRASEISMIFQEPMSSLNPVFTVGMQMREAVADRKKLSKHEVDAVVESLLEKVRIPNPTKTRRMYPFELSGGMCQRVMIAMAMARNPSLLIADEPTTSLDVTIQAQIIELLVDLRAKNDMSVLFITHDLSLLSEVADDILVMYLGRVVERAACKELIENPLHPYTKALLKSVPTFGAKKRGTLTPIPGSVADSAAIEHGCPFRSRCPHAMERCATDDPPAIDVNRHVVACWLYAANRQGGA